jgi:peroxiredoxin
MRVFGILISKFEIRNSKFEIRRLPAAPLRLCGVSLLLFLLGLASPVCAGTDPLQALGLQTPNESVEAPTFSLSDLTGKKVQLKDYRGRLVFLNFFATWCGPCREEMPGMDRLFRAYQDKGLAMLAINMEESARTVRPFVQELKLSFSALLDTKGSVSHEYGIRALPVSFLIGREGNILWRAMGGREWDTPEMRKYFGQMVAEKKK